MSSRCTWLHMLQVWIYLLIESLNRIIKLLACDQLHSKYTWLNLPLTCYTEQSGNTCHTHICWQERHVFHCCWYIQTNSLAKEERTKKCCSYCVHYVWPNYVSLPNYLFVYTVNKINTQPPDFSLLTCIKLRLILLDVSAKNTSLIISRVLVRFLKAPGSLYPNPRLTCVCEYMIINIHIQCIIHRIINHYTCGNQYCHGKCVKQGSWLTQAMHVCADSGTDSICTHRKPNNCHISSDTVMQHWERKHHLHELQWCDGALSPPS